MSRMTINIFHLKKKKKIIELTVDITYSAFPYFIIYFRIQIKITELHLKERQILRPSVQSRKLKLSILPLWYVLHYQLSS
jgi:hypothetical protein